MGTPHVARCIARAWRTATRVARAVLLVAAVAVALVGAMLGPPAAVLFWAPVTGLVTLGAARLAVGMFGDEPGGRRPVLVSGVVGFLLVPFTSGLGALGRGGGLLLIAMLVMGALRVAELAVDAPDAGPALALRRKVTVVRRVLPGIPFEGLLEQWRQAAPEIGPDADPEVRIAAAELRSLLLDELSRRDPAGVEQWLHAGAGDPGRYLRPGDAGRAVRAGTRQPRRPAQSSGCRRRCSATVRAGCPVSVGTTSLTSDSSPAAMAR